MWVISIIFKSSTDLCNFKFVCQMRNPPVCLIIMVLIMNNPDFSKDKGQHLIIVSWKAVSTVCTEAQRFLEVGWSSWIH